MSGSLFTADPSLLGLMALQISYCRYSPSKIQFKQTNTHKCKSRSGFNSFWKLSWPQRVETWCFINGAKHRTQGKDGQEDLGSSNVFLSLLLKNDYLKCCAFHISPASQVIPRYQKCWYILSPDIQLKVRGNRKGTLKRKHAAKIQGKEMIEMESTVKRNPLLTT